LTQDGGVQIGEKDTGHAEVFSSVAFPQGRYRFGEGAWLGGMGQHPRGDLSQVGQRGAVVERERPVLGGEVGSGFVGQVGDTGGICGLEKTEYSSLGP
jgi:hypothetical protein